MIARQETWASLCAATGALALPAGYVALDVYGPAARVARGSLLADGLVLATLPLVVAAALGPLVAGELRRLLAPRALELREARLVAGCLAGVAVGALAGGVVAAASRHLAPGVPPAVFVGAGAWLLAWGGGRVLARGRAGPAPRAAPRWGRCVALAALLVFAVGRQLGAFPADGSVAEREAWARANVREYPALARLVAALPEVRVDTGRVVAIAPTASDAHAITRTRAGDELSFALDVVGERGAGIFRADCTLSGARVVDWRVGRWEFGGQSHAVRRALLGASVERPYELP